MRRNGYLGDSGRNLTPPFAPATSISNNTDVFPLPSDVYGIYSMFSCYYVAWPRDLDLLTLRVFCVQCFSCPTHIPIFIILLLSVTELWVTEFGHISVIRHSHRMRRVTWPIIGGGSD